MSEPSDPNLERKALRDQIIGLGASSVRKSYYPQLQQQIDQLEKTKAALEEKSDSLQHTLDDLETAHRRAEENERKFRTLFEGLSDGVVVAEPNTGELRKVNAAFCQMLGYSEAELLQLTIPDIHPPEELPRLMEAIAKQKRGMSVLIKNLPFKRKDGTIFYTDTNGTALDLENRHCVLGVCRDITERKLAEEALSREQEFNRALVENIVDAVVACNVNFELTLFNRAAREWHGVDATTVPPEQWAEFYHLFCADGVTPMTMDNIPLARAFRGETLHNEPMVIWAKDQPPRHVLANSAPFFDGQGRKLGAVAVLHDITERKRAEQALVKSEQKYRELVENANSIILRWSPEGYITYLNEFGLTFFGYSEGEILGRQLPDTIVPETESTGRNLIPLMSEIRADPKKFEHNINENIRRNGERVWIAWTNKVVLNNEGQIKEILSIGSDVTERIRAEEALKQAKDAAEAANRAKDQFIAVLSHELRTPLTPVLTAVALLQSYEELPKNIRAEAKLIDDLLDVTRISRGIIELHREEVDVHACLMKTLDICRSEIAEKGMEVSLSLRAKDYHVWADTARLQQVFWNLLKNAVKFTPKEGKISIRTLNADRRLKIEIADTGIGIEPEVFPRIFNAFEQGEKTWTRRFGGLGLGLSIAKALVELHQGSLTAQSEGRNKGSIFTVELEPMASAPGAALNSAALLPQKNAHRKILLVEDHADTLRILSRLLQKWGYTVKCSDGVAKALDLAASESFDILVSDIGLPDGSGLDIMRQTKERYGLRGIALSGFGTDDDRLQSLAAGFEEHLTKPIGVESLREAVERILQTGGDRQFPL